MSATQAAASPYLAVREDWLDLLHEPILDAALPIIDPHHHLWDRPGWRYMPHDLLADVGSGHNIIATVFVQARAFHRADGPEELQPVGETEFVNGAAAMGASGLYGPGRICAGIVGHADLRLGAAVDRVLEAHIRAGGDRFRGIRHIVATDADEAINNPGNPAPAGLLGDAKFREGFARLAPMGMSFEAWLYHPQIDELTDLARAFPGTAIVLNHVGGPLGIGRFAGKHAEVFPGWAASIKRLAACPNVFVKLGGLGMRINGFGFDAHPLPPSSDTLAAAWKPYIDTCIAAFGAERSMFESNFPVDKGSYSYPVFWNACKKLAAGASADERKALFRGSANRFYRLGLAV
jgi:predicted TIM-barrel fold metal-dependent hydrolase